MTPTDDEVLRALGDHELTSIEISRRIDMAWKESGRQQRFLFWTSQAEMNFSDIYRIMKRLSDAGRVTMRRVGDHPRCFYRAVRD